MAALNSVLRLRVVRPGSTWTAIKDEDFVAVPTEIGQKCGPAGVAQNFYKSADLSGFEPGCYLIDEESKISLPQQFDTSFDFVTNPCLCSSNDSLLFMEVE
eukprot:scaffold127602_cov60-Cyclotella_meneghiniana.AAC.6